jgi:hypothetical protein
MQQLRDRNGVLIGLIESLGDQLVIRKPNGVRLGTYNPRIDVTYDRNGVRVGQGSKIGKFNFKFPYFLF